MKPAVVIPAYNEELMIGDVINKCKEHVDDVIVVNDGSSDRTAETAEKAGAFVLSHGANKGYGQALIDGIKTALERGHDVVITLDGDGQHNPDDIPKFLNAMKYFDADIVSGSRFLGNFMASQFHRRFGIKVLTAIPYFLCGLHMSDTQCGFRAYRKEVFEKVSLSDRGMGFSVELPIKAKQKGFSFMEVPVTVKYNNSVRLKSSFRHGLKVLFAIFRHWWKTW